MPVSLAIGCAAEASSTCLARHRSFGYDSDATRRLRARPVCRSYASGSCRVVSGSARQKRSRSRLTRYCRERHIETPWSTTFAALSRARFHSGRACGTQGDSACARLRTFRAGALRKPLHACLRLADGRWTVGYFCLQLHEIGNARPLVHIPGGLDALAGDSMTIPSIDSSEPIAILLHLILRQRSNARVWV
jgi:hypothetical protein